MVSNPHGCGLSKHRMDIRSTPRVAAIRWVQDLVWERWPVALSSRVVADPLTSAWPGCPSGGQGQGGERRKEDGEGRGQRGDGWGKAIKSRMGTGQSRVGTGWGGPGPGRARQGRPASPF